MKLKFKFRGELGKGYWIAYGDIPGYPIIAIDRTALALLDHLRGLEMAQPRRNQ